ncbi:Receptor-recognising protein Gp38 [uncultured Caudovirales phage]|uniref:Receptor-recognising protein Gp38 n=1 Tax=uncultured Caudovirales phage TaxID=2100421 RepID=A0A6J5L3X5_9CAUD|nr:Receptor-recognising protein Gp38 [uncultured Caudovirales phage]
MMQNILVSYGSVARVEFVVTVESQWGSYVISPSKISGYLPGATTATFVVTGDIGSPSAGSAAVVIDSSWHPNDSVALIINNGTTVLGKGGDGNSGSGGPAIIAYRAVTITNNGIVGGGGGGGAAGQQYETKDKNGNTTLTGASGGGGGAGNWFGWGGGGSAAAPGKKTYNTLQNGASGASGTMFTGGAGGDGYAGAGGGLGQFGASGGADSWGYVAMGGIPGAALVGLSFVNSGNGILGTVYGAQT